MLQKHYEDHKLLDNTCTCILRTFSLSEGTKLFFRSFPSLCGLGVIFGRLYRLSFSSIFESPLGVKGSMDAMLRILSAEGRSSGVLSKSFLTKRLTVDPKNLKSKDKTRCVCETQMSLIMGNSKDGQDHKDIYFDSSRKILPQEMPMSIIYLFRNYDQCQIKKN